jgi:nicotinate-nucleotide--dimethylbenzimidazole phosphoribosyltransferase
LNLLKETTDSIKPLYSECVVKAWQRIDNLTKPIGSLGGLEEIAAKLIGITGKTNNSINKKNIIIMCADNGVTEEGVSACPQNITAIVTKNFTKHITGVCKLAQYSNSDITVVDVGVNADFDNKTIINKKIAYGTKNMAIGPAMTKDEAIRAIEVGIETVNGLVSSGYDLLGTGEMGIGNTTTSAAVLSVLSGMNSDLVVGKGSGLTQMQYENKKSVVKRSIQVNAPNKNDVIDVLAKVGGFDIAALCGCFLAAASLRVPIVIDGFISSAAALCAYRINPLCKEYMFPSHLSAETGAIYMMNELNLTPMLNLNMRLGEGSGCALAFNIIEAALYTINNMATFQEAEIIKDCYVDIR